jgi:hypothetical protein
MFLSKFFVINENLRRTWWKRLVEQMFSNDDEEMRGFLETENIITSIYLYLLVAKFKF